ncbi:MAG: chromosomal replication initiator protein DnaA [Anaerolineae bacterium]|jgi:chromosomal replication initiator protein
MNAARIWSAALGELQLQMTQATFETWLRDSRLVKCEDGTFVIAVKSGYAKDWLEHRLLSTIKRTLIRLAGRTVDVRFVVGSDEPREEEDAGIPLLNVSSSPQRSPTSEEPARTPSGGDLNPRYTFDSFVVGPGNRLAHAASMAATESPAGAYNPLFIYGGVGLGKTHLLHAMGHACQAQGIDTLYVSSETFTNDLIEAIRSHTTDTFREKYRTADVLLVDDIQFIAGKERTQEEFFHTFNALHSADKQIVLSSDRAPKALSTLEGRLCSRFEWGLIADIQAPDLETRIAILRSKAAFDGRRVPDEILSIIATQIQSNIRELEGALNQVMAIARLTDQPLTSEVAKMALGNLLPQRRELPANEIIDRVAHHFGLQSSQLKGRSRKRDIARPRQIAMYLIREETDASLPQIGGLLDGRDHSTILYGCERVADLLEQDVDFRREVNALRQQLYERARAY